VEISGKAFDCAHAKVADAMKAIMSWAREACQSLECELATAAYDILLGFGFALIDNVIFNQQRPKLVKKIGPMLNQLSSILARASGGGGGMQLAFAGVEGYAASIGISGTAVGSLIGSIGVVGAGVVVVFADVTGIGHDAGKFMESIQDASKGTGNFGNLSKAGEYGIKPYNKMKKHLKVLDFKRTML